MNDLSNFTANFKHHKIKGAKAKPNNEIFFAGIFALYQLQQLTRCIYPVSIHN
jgi:hypothetical protein